jgi:hypothetical protein
VEKFICLWLLTLWAMGLGVLFYPINVLKSFRQGLTMHNALTCGLSKQEIYKLSVIELRQFLSNKPKSSKNPYLWMAISFITFLTPFFIGIIIIIYSYNYCRKSNQKLFNQKKYS